MLESTIWRQYHNENSFRDSLAEFCVMNIVDLLVDDKALYAMLKAKLTKKELKLFAMDRAGLDDENLKNEFSYNDKELEEAKFKLYKKLKQDKIRLFFREKHTAIGE